VSAPACPAHHLYVDFKTPWDVIRGKGLKVKAIRKEPIPRPKDAMKSHA
jgi:hypothetical protein